MQFGAHVSISGGLFNAPQNGLDSGCDVVQIFTRNQMQWRVKDLSGEEVERFKLEEQRTGVKAVCVHASYLINLGGSDATKLKLSRTSFMAEMTRAEMLGIPYLVVHPGSHMGEGEEAGLRRIAESLNDTIDRCSAQNVKILLESTAGQGDNLGYTFEHLGEIKSKVEATDRIGYCLDTCHMFAAGYELRDKVGYSESMMKLDAAIDSDDIGVIHCNDSKKPFGSRLDRHEHIAEGHIGPEGFGFLVNDGRFKNVPFIIETPGGPEKDNENLKMLRSLVDPKHRKLA